MADLRWYEVSPPRDIDLDAVTGLLRTLATRGPGWPAATPVVVFELWGAGGGEVRWLLGADRRIAEHLPQRLRAQVPHLGLTRLNKVKRPPLMVGAEVRLPSLVIPLRTDTAGALASALLATLRELPPGEAACLQWVVGPYRRRGSRPQQRSFAEALGLRPPREPDATANRLWREKAAEPLLACRGRVGASSDTTAQAAATVRRVAASLQLASSHGAALRVGQATRTGAKRVTAGAVPKLLWSCLLNVAELAALLGWPVQESVPDGLPVVGGHVNPAPTRLLVPEGYATRYAERRVLGESLHPSQRGELVTVPASTSLHHLHVVGPTGSGKSTLLCGLITADIAAGHSVLVVEPKGDLVTDVLGRVPADRRDRVVVIDPANAERVVGLNVLAGSRDQAERRADQIVDLLGELHGDNFGPRTADVALHALVTVSRLPDGMLTDVPVLLGNPVFRRQVLAQVNDPLVLGPWWAWYDSLSDAQRGQIVAPLLNKLRAFQSRDSLRRMLGQAKPRFSLDEVFTTPGTVVLVNLNKGSLGGPAASLLGALLLTQAWAGIQRRAALASDNRPFVSVVIDEYQDYLRLPGVDMADALAQARGLGVGLVLAHQHLDQLSASQRSAILANARSRVVFRPATADAKVLAAALGGDVTADDLLRLKAFEACAQLLLDSQPSQPFSVRTLPLPPRSGDPDGLRRASAARYGVDWAAIDAALTERWQGGDAPPAQIGVKARGRL